MIASRIMIASNIMIASKIIPPILVSLISITSGGHFM